MPRKTKRTMSGEPGQPARTPVGAVYGEGERALESQRRMPVPDRAGPAAEIGGGGGESSGGAPATFANALTQAQAMAPPEPVMGAPTRRPGEDLTRGMAGGEAPIGPRPIVNEALYELRAIAQQHPYADFMAWLERIERGG